MLDATLRLVRRDGWAATTVEAVCAAAGVSKGAFFHHFPSKEALGVAAAERWSQVTGDLFAQAPYHAPADPLARVLGYVAFRRRLLRGAPPDFTCFVGTVVQEAHAASPALREACGRSIFGHAATLEADIAEAMAARGVDLPGGAAALARHTQAVLQGAFILAKAGGGAAAAAESVDHLSRYLRLLFNAPEGGDDDARP
ncbi:MAG: TetR/AcrR family transcriptional regulator [Pseudomonadota bacterium]